MSLPFVKSMEALEAIWNGDGDAKHGDDWLDRSDHVDAAASERHGRAHNIAAGLIELDPEDDLPQANEPSFYDHDSGKPTLAHRVLRDLCRLERFLRACNVGSSTGNGGDG